MVFLETNLISTNMNSIAGNNSVHSIFAKLPAIIWRRLKWSSIDINRVELSAKLTARGQGLGNVHPSPVRDGSSQFVGLKGVRSPNRVISKFDVLKFVREVKRV